MNIQHDAHCYLHLPPPYPGAPPEVWRINSIHSQIYFNCTLCGLFGPNGLPIHRTLIIPPHIQSTLADPKVATPHSNAHTQPNGTLPKVNV